MNILIVKMSALGDVTHTLPALTALRRAYPDACISWLIEETAAPLVEGHSALNRVLIWRRRPFTEALRSGRWFRAMRLVRDFVRVLRDTRYDLILDFQALLKSGVWVGLARGERKVGFGQGLDHSEGSYVFLNERVPAVSKEMHALDRGLMLLEAIGIPRGPVIYDLPVRPESVELAASELGAVGVGQEERYIAMHPVARWETKLWLPERFAAVADALSERGFRVVITGAKKDGGWIDAIFARVGGGAVRLDGRLDLRGLAALFKRAAVVVSTDTGPMHIAAAVGTPVVAVFGPTAPNRTGPYGGEHVVVRSGVACSPCLSRRCRSSVAEEMACMKRLEAVEVVRAVMEIVGRKSSGGDRAARAVSREVAGG